jgi:hypothetical protein
MSNKQQNREFKEAVRRIEQTLGRGLSKEEQRMLHLEISRQGHDLNDIVAIGLALFPD